MESLKSCANLGSTLSAISSSCRSLNSERMRESFCSSVTPCACVSGLLGAATGACAGVAVFALFANGGIGIVVGGGVGTLGRGVFTDARAVTSGIAAGLTAAPLLLKVGAGGGVGIIGVAVGGPSRRELSCNGTASFAAAIAFANRSGLATDTA